MRRALQTALAVVLAAGLVAACGPSPLKRASLPGEDEARGAKGKIAILIRDVIPYGFTTGKPTACAITYDVFNNSSAHLDGASAAVASYPFPLAALPPHTEYSQNQMVTVTPAAGSCAGVVDALSQGADDVQVSQCSIGGAASDDCAGMVVAVVGIDQGAQGQIRQAEAQAAQQYAAQLAQAFAQAKAEAWAKRGAYQAGVGGGFVEANPAAPVLLAGVIISPDFNPAKPAATAPETTDYKLCAPNPNDATDQTPGRLAVLAVTKDPYGLADWYRLGLFCSGHPEHTLWIKAAVVERMAAAGQVTRQERLAAATPPPAPAAPTAAKAAAPAHSHAAVDSSAPAPKPTAQPSPAAASSTPPSP